MTGANFHHDIPLDHTERVVITATRKVNGVVEVVTIFEYGKFYV